MRVLRLWTSDQDLEIPAPPNGGSRRFRIGVGSERSFGWAAIEVNKDKAAVIVYTVTGPDDYAGARYNVWIHDEPKLRFGHFLKSGLGTMDDSADSDFTRWGDLAGASVDFVGGKQADGVWVAHQYARSNGIYGIWVGKVFGKTYPDFYLEAFTVRLRGDRRLALAGRIGNGGDRSAPSTSLTFDLLRPDGGLVRLGSLKQRRLGEGRRRRFALEVARPAALEPGPHLVLVTAEERRRVKEYSERNNAALAAFTVPGQGPPVPLPEPMPGAPGPPDLVLAELTTGSFTVENRGASAAGPFEVTVSGAGAFTFDGLAPGAAGPEPLRLALLAHASRAGCARGRPESGARVERGQQRRPRELLRRRPAGAPLRRPGTPRRASPRTPTRPPGSHACARARAGGPPRGRAGRRGPGRACG